MTTRLICAFIVGLNVGVILGISACGLFAFVLWMRLRNKNRGGNNAHDDSQ